MVCYRPRIQYYGPHYGNGGDINTNKTINLNLIETFLKKINSFQIYYKNFNNIIKIIAKLLLFIGKFI